MNDIQVLTAGYLYYSSDQSGAGTNLKPVLGTHPYL